MKKIRVDIYLDERLIDSKVFGGKTADKRCVSFAKNLLKFQQILCPDKKMKVIYATVR